MECNGIDFGDAFVEALDAIVETFNNILREFTEWSRDFFLEVKGIMTEASERREESKKQRHKWFPYKQFCGYKEPFRKRPVYARSFC